MPSFGTQVVVDDELLDYELSPRFAASLTVLKDQQATSASRYIYDPPRAPSKSLCISSWKPAVAKPVEPAPEEPWFQQPSIISGSKGRVLCSLDLKSMCFHDKAEE